MGNPGLDPGLHVPLLDHLIISEKTYYSFSDNGLLEELEQSTKYVPDYKLKEALKKQVSNEVQQKNREQERKALAKAMKAKGYSVAEIAELTGLSKSSIGKLKTD